MCGIAACVGDDDATATLLSGLANLEYRGYDSAGIAVRNGDGLEVCKREGELAHLERRVATAEPSGELGVGHTRWSTHGPPTDENAHPHVDCSGTLAVVHNGIVENYDELRADLRDCGHEFTSDTDTEVIPHLVEDGLQDGLDHEAAFHAAIDRLDGSFAVAMVADGYDAVLAARQGSPLVLGIGDGRRFLASDVPAFLEHTDRVVFLQDGDVAVVTADDHRVTDRDGRAVERTPETVEWDATDAQKRGYDHYMLKEIHEQPAALARTVQGRIVEEDEPATADEAGDGSLAVALEEFPPGSFDDVSEVQFVACGTSYHAALYVRQLLLDRGVSAHVFRAGEYATNPAPVDEETLVVGVTQSGETADTLGSLRRAAEGDARTLAVTNVVGSTAARECDDALFIRAGPEIGVAATKTFSAQVATLALLGERLVEDVTGSPSADRDDLLRALRRLPEDVQAVLDGSTARQFARTYRDGDAFFFIGRGSAYPVAMEGALKFKEITYEHAEGFAAGQLKHGPLALVTPETPVVAVFSGRHGEKTRSNVEEVRARGAPVVAVAPPGVGADRVADEVLAVPETHPDLAGVLANVHLQLVSYHVADLYGRSIDKPRNLAKSVTVE